MTHPPMRATRWRVTIAALALAVGAATQATPATAETGDDALVRRVRDELSTFTDWLDTYDVQGVIGEVGWPDDRRGDADEWNAVAEAWYDDADAAGLAVTAWATGEWWGDYPLAVWDPTPQAYGLAGPSTQAPVVLAHPGTTAAWRGVNVAGGEFAAPTVEPTSSFSNANRGTYDVHYHYDSQATFDRLAADGVRVVRLPFRWERIQPAIGRPLDSQELARLRAAVARAGRAGLRVVLDVHNYGGYYRSDGTRGVRAALGTTRLTRFDFADLWGRMSNNFKNDPVVLGYGLMNEPADLAPAGSLSPAQVWERASQEALNRIRRNGDRKLVLVAGYAWSGVQRWSTNHPRPWITDPAANVRYEAHHYWDRDNSGDYPDRYADEVADADRRGW
jgi:hypothetical protein